MGFSGNGNCELSVGEAMCEIDAALYVIDCNPNTKAEGSVMNVQLNSSGCLRRSGLMYQFYLLKGTVSRFFLKDQVYSEPGKKNKELSKSIQRFKDLGN